MKKLLLFLGKLLLTVQQTFYKPNTDSSSMMIFLKRWCNSLVLRCVAPSNRHQKKHAYEKNHHLLQSVNG